jgi:hypothetical protein
MATAALALIAGLRDGRGSEPSYLIMKVGGQLTRPEEEFLHAYNQDMVQT